MPLNCLRILQPFFREPAALAAAAAKLSVLSLPHLCSCSGVAECLGWAGLGCSRKALEGLMSFIH